MRLPGMDAVREIASGLRAAGYEAMVVGGAVRDMLLGNEPADFDIVTTARPEKVAELFPGAETVGAGFGVTLVGAVEVASARRERFYMDGRHPELVEYADTLEEDAVRRDFTVNALLLDPFSGEVADHVGGAADLRAGVIRTIGDAGTRFREDYLRMLRGVRFASGLGFALESATAAAIRELAGLTAELAPERVREELASMLVGPAPGKAVRMLEATGLLAVVLPEAARLRSVEQPREYHPEGDVLTHTCLMLDHMTAPDPRLAWSVLFHDAGKYETFSRDASGRIHFFGHEKSGAEIAASVMARLRFSRADSADIRRIVDNHMNFGMAVREAKLRRNEADPLFPLELELNRLDALAGNGCFDGFLRYLDRRIAAAGRERLPAPLIGGDDLIAAGHRPGPLFKTVLELVYDAQLEGGARTRAEALALAEAEWRRLETEPPDQR